MKILTISFLLLFAVSCESKAQKNTENFCVNTNKIKTQQECNDCLAVLDKMFSENKITKTDYIVKKLNYFLLLKKYDDAMFFLDKEEFTYPQEKEIRKQEILLVKYFCGGQTEEYSKQRESLLSYIDQELLTNKDQKVITILKNEKSAIKSNLIVDYYCSKSEKKNEEEGVSIQSGEAE